MTQTFTVEHLRVRFHDVDHAGIIFFAKIYEYCHVAYEEFVESVLGLGPRDFFEARKLGAPLVATSSEHFHPLFHGDHMRIHCFVRSMGRTSVTMGYRVENQDGVLCANVTCKHAFVTRDPFKSVPIPDELRARLTPYHHTTEPSSS